jgi:hypothetical protein
MTPLPTVICKGGFDLTLVRRGGRAAIYRQHFRGDSPNHDAYEVILPQCRNTNYSGQLIDPYKGYPPAESWGRKGWTFTSLGKAVQKLNRLAEASRPGTVSRKNRFEGRTGSGAGSWLMGSRFVPATQRFALPVGQKSQTLGQRKAKLSSGRYPVPPTYNLDLFNGTTHSKQHNSATCGATESKRGRRGLEA